MRCSKNNFWWRSFEDTFNAEISISTCIEKEVCVVVIENQEKRCRFHKCREKTIWTCRGRPFPFGGRLFVLRRCMGNPFSNVFVGLHWLPIDHLESNLDVLFDLWLWPLLAFQRVSLLSKNHFLAWLLSWWGIVAFPRTCHQQHYISFCFIRASHPHRRRRNHHIAPATAATAEITSPHITPELTSISSGSIYIYTPRSFVDPQLDVVTRRKTCLTKGSEATSHRSNDRHTVGTVKSCRMQHIVDYSGRVVFIHQQSTWRLAYPGMVASATDTHRWTCQAAMCESWAPCVGWTANQFQHV